MSRACGKPGCGSKEHRLVARLGEPEALGDEAREGVEAVRGSRSGIDDLSAAECVRSGRIEAPRRSPSPITMTEPPMTPAEAMCESASDATLVPTTDFHVTAPRIG